LYHLRFQFRSSLSLLIHEFPAIVDVLVHPCFFFRQRPGSYWLVLWRPARQLFCSAGFGNGFTTGASNWKGA
jgi:hypothetical protein